MKRRASISLLVLLITGALPVCAAQDDNQAKQGSLRSEKSAKKTIRISGRVGLEGKTLVSDRGNRIWKVLNPDLLSASEGRLVTIKAYAGPNLSEIRVAVVRLREQRTTAKLDDAAFRR